MLFHGNDPTEVATRSRLGHQVHVVDSLNCQGIIQLSNLRLQQGGRIAHDHAIDRYVLFRLDDINHVAENHGDQFHGVLGNDSTFLLHQHHALVVFVTIHSKAHSALQLFKLFVFERLSDQGFQPSKEIDRILYSRQARLLTVQNDVVPYVDSRRHFVVTVELHYFGMTVVESRHGNLRRSIIYGQEVDHG